MKAFPRIVCLSLLGLFLPIVGCKTKSEIRREQEMERMKADFRDAKSTRADLETISEELRADLTRLSNSVEDGNQAQRTQNEEVKKELLALNTRMQAIEQRAVAEEAAAKAAAKAAVESRSKQTFENGKKLYDEERFEEAIDILKGVIATKPKTDDARRSQLLIADCYFAARDFASAALEYSEFKKDYPRDTMVPNATYRQALSFKNMGKAREAKLFYQELIDRFPRNQLAFKAKQEIKKVK